MFLSRHKRRLLIAKIRRTPIKVSTLHSLLQRIKTAIARKKRQNRVGRPSSMMVELTNLCNLKCITCPREYSFGAQMDKGMMDLELFKSIIDEVGSTLDSLGLTGLGETFLYKDLISAVDYVRDQYPHILLFVSINAHLPKSVEIASKLRGKIDTLQVSMDGLGETYDTVRLGGSFDTFDVNFRQIVQLMQGSQTGIVLNAVIVAENFRQMADMIEYAGSLGLRSLNMTPVNLASMPDAQGFKLDFLQTAEFKMSWQRAVEVAKEYPELEWTAPNFGSLGSMGMCSYLYNHFYVTWDGKMPPCCAKPFPKEFSYGSVRDGVMNTINSEIAQNFRNEWHRDQIPSFCHQCVGIQSKESK